jgi:hypothetical protein
VNSELKVMWQEAAVAYFVALSRYLPGVTEGKTKTPVPVASIRDSADHAAAVLPSEQRHSVSCR